MAKSLRTQNPPKHGLRGTNTSPSVFSVTRYEGMVLVVQTMSPSVHGPPNPPPASTGKSSLNAIEPGDKLIGAAGGGVTLYVGLRSAVHRVEHHEAVLGPPILGEENRNCSPEIPAPPLRPGTPDRQPLLGQTQESGPPGLSSLNSPKTHVSPEVCLGRRTTIKIPVRVEVKGWGQKEEGET